MYIIIIVTQIGIGEGMDGIIIASLSLSHTETMEGQLCKTT
jgi:hypothetical protein